MQIMKKIVYFSFIALLIFIGCSKADNNSAIIPSENQLKSVPYNGTDSYYYTGGYFADLICEEIVIDHLSGNVQWHVRDHYKSGQLEWSIYNASGSLTSENGEVFEIHESDKLFYSQVDWTFHCNLTGNLGSHYILSGHGDLTTWEVIVDKANCPPSN
jgi:hypothetical protein